MTPDPGADKISAEFRTGDGGNVDVSPMGFTGDVDVKEPSK